MDIFSDNLRKLRRDYDVTQTALAKALGIPQTTISSWENRSSEPSFTNLIRIADYFKVTTDFLLGKEVKKPIKETTEPSHIEVIEKPQSDNTQTNKEPELTKDEEVLLEKYRKLTLFQKAAVMGYLDGFLCSVTV